MLLGYKDRAEIAGSEFGTAASLSVLEGVVIVEKKATDLSLQPQDATAGN